MSAEWCQHEPPVLVHRTDGGHPIMTHVRFSGLAPQADVSRIRHPDGFVGLGGNLVIRLYAPAFPWYARITTRIGQRKVYDNFVGSEQEPLAAGQDEQVVIPLVTP